jgi:hypothetical protein
MAGTPPEAPVMEPVAVVTDHDATASPDAAGSRARAAQSPIVEVDVEREVIGTGLYRERRIVEEVVEEEVAPPSSEERRRERRRRARARTRPRAGGGLRGTLGYKFFYDIVCNRVGLVLAGFGTVLLLFVMLYDPMRRVPLEFGPKHMLAVAVSGAVYGVGMVFEMLRAWSWECEGAEGTVDGDGDGPGQSTSARAPRGRDLDAAIPLVPDDALAQLVGEVSTDGGFRRRRRRRGRGRAGG